MANSRNYRVPSQDDKADVPYWNDLLAKDVAKDIDGLEAELRLDPLTVAYTEDWESASDWTTGGNLFTVQGGRLYGPASGPSVINRVVPVGADGRARYTTDLRHVIAETERFTFAGWSKAAAGTASFVPDFLAVGIYRNPGSQYARVVSLVNGQFIYGPFFTVETTTFSLTFERDAASSSVRLESQDGTIVWTARQDRADFVPEQLAFYIGDYMTTNGDSFGPVVGSLPTAETVKALTEPLVQAVAELQEAAEPDLSGTFADAALALRGKEASDAALAAAQIEYTDAAGLLEPWADTAGWTGAGAFVASGGKLYGPPSPDGHIGRAVPVGANGRALYRVALTIAPGGNERYVTAGWSTAPAGTRPAFGNMLAVGFHVYPSGDTYPITVLNGTVSRVGATAIPAGGTYMLTIGQDETQSWAELTTANGSSVWKIQALKADYAPAQIALRHDDFNRGTAGDSFGPVAGRAAWVTHAQDPYKANPIGIWGIDPAGGEPFHVWIPANYDPRRGAPLALVPHGWGGHELSGAENYGAPGNGDWAITAALLGAGFIVANSRAEGGSNAGHGYPHYPKLWRYLTGRLPIGRVVIWSTSFGGPSGLRLIADREVPNISAWVGTFPVTNLASIHARNDVLRDGIDAAWGSLEAAQAAGADPNLYPPSAFRGIRMRVRHSYADNTVYKTDNVDLLHDRIASYTDEFAVIETVGPHGDPSNFVDLAQEIDFLNRALGRK